LAQPEWIESRHFFFLTIARCKSMTSEAFRDILRSLAQQHEVDISEAISRTREETERRCCLQREATEFEPGSACSPGLEEIALRSFSRFPGNAVNQPRQGSRLSRRAQLTEWQLPEAPEETQLFPGIAETELVTCVERVGELRMWFLDTPDVREALRQTQMRVEGMLAMLLAKQAAKLQQDGKARAKSIETWRQVASRYFEREAPYEEQHFLAGTRCEPKATSQEGTVSFEVRHLGDVSSEGLEFWDDAGRADAAVYAKLPCVTLRKERRRWSVLSPSSAGRGSAVLGTPFEGLQVLEISEVQVLDAAGSSSQSLLGHAVSAELTGAPHRLEAKAYLSIVLEGTPAAIEAASHELQLAQLVPLSIPNVDADGLYRSRHNVSVSRFLLATLLPEPATQGKEARRLKEQLGEAQEMIKQLWAGHQNFKEQVQERGIDLNASE